MCIRDRASGDTNHYTSFSADVDGPVIMGNRGSKLSSQMFGDHATFYNNNVNLLKTTYLNNNPIYFRNTGDKNHGIELSPVDDTMLLSYTLDAGNNRHNMDTLSELHLGHKSISYKEIVGTGKKQLNFAEVDLKSATEYAAEDADVTLRLYELLSERFIK